MSYVLSREMNSMPVFNNVLNKIMREKQVMQLYLDFKNGMNFAEKPFSTLNWEFTSKTTSKNANKGKMSVKGHQAKESKKN